MVEHFNAANCQKCIRGVCCEIGIQYSQSRCPNSNRSSRRLRIYSATRSYRQVIFLQKASNGLDNVAEFILQGTGKLITTELKVLLQSKWYFFLRFVSTLNMYCVDAAPILLIVKEILIKFLHFGFGKKLSTGITYNLVFTIFISSFIVKTMDS